MHQPTSDLRIRAQKPLISPAVLEGELPLSDEGARLVASTRRDVAAIVTGADDRLLVVVGPCSIHDSDAAQEYAARLKEIARIHVRELLIVMRVYFEKPRTVMGWKGLINDPQLDDSYEISTGLRLARTLMRAVVELGLPVGTEFLDTTLGQYYADLVSWGAIGARTVESQVHRELASGLSMPVGFKNRTDGNVSVAIDAIRSARYAHWFPSLNRDGAAAVLGTTGNDHTHLVLRGGSDGPNFSAAHVQAAVQMLRSHQLPPHVMIDCSHANSGKDPARQPAVARELATRLAAGDRSIAALMLESHLLSGTQDYRQRPLVRGRSITDACLAWEETIPVLDALATAVRQRRG